MRVIDFDAKIIVPIVDETKGGMVYEAQMTVAEFFKKFGIDVSELVFDAVPAADFNEIMSKRLFRLFE